MMAAAVAAPSLVTASVAAPNATAQEAATAATEHRVELSSPARQTSLSVQLVWGSITVRSHAAADVRFEVREDRPEDGLRSLAASKAYEIRQLEDRVELIATPPGEGVFEALDVTVLVPEGLDIDLEMERGGDINVEGVSGSLEISNLNGSVHLAGIEGDALVDAKNGEIRADFRRVTPGQPLTFATLNGGVYVTLPSATKADLQVVTATGDVRTDFPVEVDETAEGPPASRGPAAGRPTIDIKGRMNGGGPLLYIQTHNGPVRLLKGEG
jgi:hypothetical protein